MGKLNKNQLLEMIRDTIYEVLEEEVDKRLQEAKKAKAVGFKKASQNRKQVQESRSRATSSKRTNAQSKTKAIRQKRAKLAEAYKKLKAQEKKLTESRTSTLKKGRPADVRSRRRPSRSSVSGGRK